MIRCYRRTAAGLVAATAVFCLALAGGLEGAALEERPHVFEYRVNWRAWHAGDVRLEFIPPVEGSGQDWTIRLMLDTQGFVDNLYDVHNRYEVVFDRDFCTESVQFDVRERKKRRDIRISYQSPPGWVRYVNRDLANDRIALTKVVSAPRCVHDELSALARFRTMAAEFGTSIELPVSNGRQSAMARVEAQKRETVETPAGTFEAIRYEALLFNNVLYKRKGRLFFWLTDDERRLPVQVRIRLKFIYGTITLRLVNEEPL